MVNGLSGAQLELFAAIAFFLALALIVYFKKSERNLQKLIAPFGIPIVYAVFYKTKLGLKFMDSVAKRFRLINIFGYAAIAVGFLGMVFIAFSLFQSLYNILFVPKALPAAGLVLPFKVKGSFYVPFFYWIISIFILALVHEMSHGIMARFYNIKVKSSGFAFIGLILPIIPAAFVEPDEKSLQKKPKRQQLAVFAAGPFANIALGGVLFVIILLIAQPLSSSISEERGVVVTGVAKGFPAEKSGISEGERIEKLNGIEIAGVANFTEALKDKKPGEEITLQTNKTLYQIILSENPDNSSKGYLGIYVAPDSGIKKEFREKYGEFIPNALLWFFGLLFWLFFLNLGIGLFNLVPIGPVDGGRMLQLLLHGLLGKERGDAITKAVSLLFVMIILINIMFAFLR